MAKRGIITHVVATPIVYTTEAVATDVLTGNFVITQRLDDTGSMQDTHTYVFAKALNDTSTFSDTHIFSMARPLANSANISETHRYTFARTLADTMSVTDDLDGQASIEDDQNINFVKARRDSAIFSDVVTRSFGTGYSDVATTSEIGYIRGQSYADFSYFAEDYVGFSQSF